MAFLEANFGLDTDDTVGFSNVIRESKEIFVTFSVFQEGSAEYLNFRYPRFKNFYGYAQLMSGEFVVESIPLVHLNQLVWYYVSYTPQIIDSIICTAILIVEALDPSASLEGQPIKTRSHITSVRFKLRAGVLANCAVKYGTYESSCGLPFLSPPESEGNPPTANNDSYDPSQQPPETEEDPLDPTRNDGVPDGNQPGGTPPGAGGDGSGQWFQIVNWSEADVDSFALGDTNPASVWSAGGSCFNTVEGDVAPPGSGAGISFYKNGVYVGCAEDSTKGDAISVRFTYVLN